MLFFIVPHLTSFCSVKSFRDCVRADAVFYKPDIFLVLSCYSSITSLGTANIHVSAKADANVAAARRMYISNWLVE